MKKTLLSFLAVTVLSSQAFAAEYITKQEVLEAQDRWADGIVKISKVYMDGGDYKAAAKKHIDDLYAYGVTDVLFKPTLAVEDPFRETFDEALSYFVGGIVPEDKGFAIKPWKEAEFDGEQHIAVYHDYAVSMGNYFFTPAKGGQPQKVEFTFGYLKDDNGNLLINVHHSSLPYDPQ